MNNNVIRCVILGDTCIGKSYLCNILTHRNVDENTYYEPTVGVEVNLVKVKINNIKIKLFFFDCSGNQKYSKIIESYLNQVDMFIVVFDERKVFSVLGAEYYLNTQLKPYINRDTFIVLINNSSTVINNPYKKKYNPHILKLIQKYNPVYIEINLKFATQKILLNYLEGPIMTICYKKSLVKIPIEVDTHCCFFR